MSGPPLLLLSLLLLLLPPSVDCAGEPAAAAAGERAAAAAAATTAAPSPPAAAPSPYLYLDLDHCQNCPIPPTIPHCGTAKNPRCRPPFSMPYKGQNGVATCARLRCPDNYDMFVNTAASARMGNRILDFTPKRVVLNPQTAICAPYLNAETYKFQIRDSEGFLRLVNDVQCQQNNFPRHSCVTDGFLQQTCTKRDRCTPIRYLSDYGGNKCNEPFKLMMKFDRDHSRWVPMKKLSCDREFGWWRIHFPNGTWMHTRYGTVATCVAMKTEDDLSSRWLSIAIKTMLLIVITLLTVAAIFNAYMTRAVVIWEGSNWQRIWRQDLLEASQLSENRDFVQRDIVRGMKQQKWHEYYERGLHMDLRQYDIMQRVVEKTDIVPNMMHWTMLDDFDYLAQKDEEKESHA